MSSADDYVSHMNSKCQTIQRVCGALTVGNSRKAAEILRTEYPFIRRAKVKRAYTKRRMMDIFVRDGFIDRYSGAQLIFWPVLRLLSQLLPAEFPYQAHWDTSQCHIAYWQLIPTVDHVLPITLAGTNDMANLVTTSQLRNSAKGNWTLAELGWTLFPEGDITEWDGMMQWFQEYVEHDPTPLRDPSIRDWHNAAKAALAAR